MRQIREVLRLGIQVGLSGRQIARQCGIGRTTVQEYLRRAAVMWPLGLSEGELEKIPEEDLERLLFPPPVEIPDRPRPLPDFQHIQDELRKHRRFNLTLDLLWQEYRKENPEGYGYSRFCELYRGWEKSKDLVMRQHHRGGEKLFVDYCDGLDVVDARTGERRVTQLWVGVWGASNFTYAEASWGQSLPEWVGSHVRAFGYFGVSPEVLVPDNLASGVTKADWWEPQINPTYQEMAAHYGCAVVPARVKKPRDKAKVEAGVLVAQRWILAVLRNRVFHSLEEMNEAIGDLLEKLNGRALRKAGKSRRELFEELDRPKARALPARAYECGEWRKARVNIDYHIEVDRHCYSVPFSLVHQVLEMRLTSTTLEVLRKGARIVAHVRSYVKGGHTTLKEHMPLSHQKHLEWTPSRMVAWAAKAGPDTAALVGKVMESRPHPELGYRTCFGIIQLERRYGRERLEAAARRALKYGVTTYPRVAAMLEAGLDREEEEPVQGTLGVHENVRGSAYYRKEGGDAG
jgi:transposase